MIELRPHHLMCLILFRGNGYSDEFTKNMKNVYDTYKQSPIKLVEKCDCICKHCPNLVEGECKTPKVKIYDKKVLELCKKYDFDSMVNFIKSDQWEKICGNCEWFEVCDTIRKEL